MVLHRDFHLPKNKSCKYYDMNDDSFVCNENK